MKLILDGMRQCPWCGKYKLRCVKAESRLFDCENCGARYQGDPE